MTLAVKKVTFLTKVLYYLTDQGHGVSNDSSL